MRDDVIANLEHFDALTHGYDLRTAFVARNEAGRRQERSFFCEVEVSATDAAAVDTQYDLSCSGFRIWPRFDPKLFTRLVKYSCEHKPVLSVCGSAKIASSCQNGPWRLM
jgi:hypothetical protein